MSSSDELSAQIKKNKKYLEEAKLALENMKKTVRNRQATLGYIAQSDLEESRLELSDSAAIEKVDQLGRYVSARNGKGWFKAWL